MCSCFIKEFDDNVHDADDDDRVCIISNLHFVYVYVHMKVYAYVYRA